MELSGLYPVKTSVIRFFINYFFGMLADDQEAKFLRIIRGLKLIAPRADQRRTLEEIAGLIKNDHPSVRLIRRLIRESHPHAREKLLNNLVINDILAGDWKRAQTARRLKMHMPAFMVISPTYACNLKCAGCYAGEYEDEQQMEPELFDRIISEGKNLGLYFYVISGGEPFFYRPLWDILAKHHDCYFLIYTNGTLIDEETAEKIARLGHIAPAISIEGKENETDFRRGEGTFRRLLTAFTNLRKARAVYGVSVTHTRRNHKILMSDEFWEMLVENKATFSWIFQYIPIGLAPDLSQMVTPEERLERLRLVERIRREKEILVADFWNDGPYVNGCLAGGANYFHINAHGYVEPCVFVHFALDNIKEKPLVEILKSPFFQEIRERAPYGENLLRPCMVIDRPEILRELYHKYQLRPTHPGAETILTSLAPVVQETAKAWAKISGPVWEREFAPRYPAVFGEYVYKGRSGRRVARTSLAPPADSP
ncbi:MAG TPA: radical SAM protein [Firmicutes bacterium]|nr:radical SAM protein [Bacillota bacterium]